RQKTDEVKFGGWQTARGQRADQCAGAGHGFHSMAGGKRRFDDPFAGVADARTPGIGDQSDLFASAQSFDDLLGAPGFVELEVTQQRLRDPEMTQELSGVAGVFGSDDVA